MLGFHVPLNDLREGLFSDIPVVQTFPGSPRTLTRIDLSNLPDRPNIIYHAPYTVTLCYDRVGRNIDGVRYSVREKTFNYLKSLKVPTVVTHIGSRKDLSKEESIELLYDFCHNFLRHNKVTTLCLENDAGSKSGTKMGYLGLLYKIVKAIDNPRLRLCYDSEHSFSAGIDISSQKILDTIKPYVRVVHLNAVPPEVTQGSHIDRHTTTLFTDSLIPISVYKNIYDTFKDSADIILERDLPYAIKDYQYIKENWE